MTLHEITKQWDISKLGPRPVSDKMYADEYTMETNKFIDSKRGREILEEMFLEYVKEHYPEELL